MNFLERIPTRWLLTGAALACLALWAAPSSAQSSGDPAAGKLLFEDTPNESGNSQLTNACTNCHSSVQERRAHISPSGGAFADISFSTALSRLNAAMNNIPGMNQFRPSSNGLSTEQVGHIAAYIADTPKLTATDLTTANTLAFVSTAVGNAVTRDITINHSIATTSNLQITNVSLAAGTTAFVRSASCVGSTRAPAGTCTFSVTYTPTSATAESKVLTVAMQIGSVAFNRSITLNGSVAGATPAPTQPPPASDEGGGALGWVWLSGLALATAVLARRRRS